MKGALMRNAFLVLLMGTSIYAADPADGTDMQYGPYLCHSVTFVTPKDHNAPRWEGAITRAMAVDVGQGATICYDVDRMTIAGLWKSGFLDRSKTHHTSYKGTLPTRPGSSTLYESWTDAGWISTTENKPLDVKLAGYYLHNNQVILSYRVADREILELPGRDKPGQFSRTLKIGPSKTSVSMFLDVATANSKNKYSVHEISGAGKLRLHEGRIYADIPANTKSQTLKITLADGKPERLPAPKPIPHKVDFASKLLGGPPRWPDVLVTHGTRAEDTAAYVIDDLPVPDSPWRSWMRLSGIDFFADGRMAVATLSGDVWIVSWPKDDIRKLEWRRFATGLYEPLGLRVVKNKIYVRGRDRITRLHDLNADGEADYYENFHSAGEIGPSYHAFLFELVNDEEGNFYFARSGRKAPSIGEVVRVSPDGKQREVISTYFRHANGMGFGGPHHWLTIADNADGKYPCGASIVREGGMYGWKGPMSVPMLYVLPPKVDSSAGSQIWSDPKRWGPLGGTLVHTSFSSSTATYVMVQDSKTHPNGFAVKFPWGFKSGVMRGAVGPRDGQMYLAAQRGWDTNAAVDGIVQRIRYTGKPAYMVTNASAIKGGIQLSFSCPLDPETVDYDFFSAERVDGKSAKEVDIEDVRALDDRTVFVEIPDLDPSQIVDKVRTKQDGGPRYRVVAPLAISFRIKAKDGTKIHETVYATVNSWGAGSP